MNKISNVVDSAVLVSGEMSLCSLFTYLLFYPRKGGDEGDEIMASTPIRRLHDPSDVLIMFGAVADTILRQELH
jgi:hypothetical protein